MTIELDKDQILTSLAVEANECAKCKLCESRGDFVVFGSGGHDADLMFIGEGPGRSESETGIPFVGQSGQLLSKMLDYCFNLTRDEVYIANIVKCRPPNNRDPKPDEIIACLDYLKQQIQVIQPRVIVTLGRVATQSLLETKERIGKLRGKSFTYDNIPVVPMTHPSYWLRRPSARIDVVADSRLVLAELDSSVNN